MHLDCQQVDLDQEIQAEVAIELEGVEDAPGVKEGGVLEHVTREITIEALPTDDPREGIIVDVSAMDINDTIQLASDRRPRAASSSSPTTPRRSRSRPSPAPRVEEEEPEVEEETELVGEGEGEGEEAAAAGEQAGDEGDSGSEG